MKWLKDLIVESESWLPLLVVAGVVVIACCVGGLTATSIWGTDAFWCANVAQACR